MDDRSYRHGEICLVEETIHARMGTVVSFRHRHLLWWGLGSVPFEVSMDNVWQRHFGKDI